MGTAAVLGLAVPPLLAIGLIVVVLALSRFEEATEGRTRPARMAEEAIDIGRGEWDFIIGIGVLAIAAGISYGTYAAAEGGGTYWIWWGPMVYAGYRIVRGIVRAFGG